MINELNQYIEDVKSNKIITGNLIKQAVQRFENDLKRTDIYFDENEVIRVIKFAKNLKHFTGKFNNQPFILENWQIFIIANIFGWKNKKTNLRKYNNVYLKIARKNGKTAIAAFISLYCLIADNEANAQIILSANSREQARICFETCQGFAKKLDPKEKLIKSFRNEVKFNGGLIKCVAANASKLDGYNASCVIYDEFHASPTSQIYDVLKSSQGMREQPLSIIITTAGFEKNYPCFEFEQNYKDVLNGIKQEDNTFIAIYDLNQGDDWLDESNYIKANPNLNVTVNQQFIKDEINKAKNNTSLEVGVKTKHLNIWCDTSNVWIPDSYINDSFQKLNIDNIPINSTLYCSVDLASTSDITSVTYSWKTDNKHHFINKYYLPTESVSTKQDKELYKQWAKQGYLTLTNGNVTDYQYIINDILNVHKQKSISILGYDNWNSTQFIIELSQYINTQSYSQAIASFNRPTKEFERLILSNQVIIDENPITKWMFSNVYLRTDSNGNVKPDKSKARKKIDGVITILQNLGLYLLFPSN